MVRRNCASGRWTRNSHGRSWTSWVGKNTATNFLRWRVAVSPQALEGGTSVAGHRLFEGAKPDSIISEDRALHLDTTRRSFVGRMD
jgi:hypothetical protein